MEYVLASEIVVVALLAVLVVGLLRSHALILRDLAGMRQELEGQQALDRAQAPPTSPPLEKRGLADLPEADLSPEALAAEIAVIEGIDLDLEPQTWEVGATGRATLIAFLSSGCLVCGQFWRDLDARGDELGDVDVVVVTKGREEENLGKLRHLAGGALRVIMSTSTWERLEVPGSPYFVLLDAQGHTIAGAGSAQDWAQMSSLIQDYLLELEILTGDDAGRTRELSRVERENAVLAAAGLDPDDPSFFAMPDSRQ